MSAAGTQGTGISCSPAADAPGGPLCKSPQVGLCCDPTVGFVAACATTFGDGPIQSEGPSSTCSPWSAFCCTQLDLPGNCYSSNFVVADHQCDTVSGLGPLIWIWKDTPLNANGHQLVLHPGFLHHQKVFLLCCAELACKSKAIRHISLPHSGPAT